MPAFETNDLYQKALLWVATGYDTDGQPTRSVASQQIDVRWTYTASQAMGPDNKVIAIDARVVTDIDIPLGSILWDGSYEDLAATLPGTGSAETSDLPLADLYQVATFSGGPDIKNRFQRTTYGLKRLSDTMPGIQV